MLKHLNITNLNKICKKKCHQDKQNQNKSSQTKLLILKIKKICY